MTTKQVENRVKKLRLLEDQAGDLAGQIEAIKDELKHDLELKGLEEEKAGDYTVRYKLVKSTRIDTTSLKKDMPGVYSDYSKESAYMRFSIAG